VQNEFETMGKAPARNHQRQSMVVHSGILFRNNVLLSDLHVLPAEIKLLHTIEN
jgi:hypothetical protein